LGKLVLCLAFSIPYLAVYLPLVILLVWESINSAAGSVGSLPNMTDREREMAGSRTFASVLNVT
jgi:hypothetical protein